MIVNVIEKTKTGKWYENTEHETKASILIMVFK